MRSPEGKITLFCKGADIVVFERLHPSSDKLMEATMKHLNVRHATRCLYSCNFNILANTKKFFLLQLKQEYAGDGLRTLVLAYKDLDESYLEEWRKRHHEASIAMEEREERLDELYEEIEKDMTVSSPVKCVSNSQNLLMKSRLKCSVICMPIATLISPNFSPIP